MKAFFRFLRQPEFPILLFAIGFGLFHWHLAASPGRESGLVTYLWLYMSWAVVILLLYLINRAFSAHDDGKDDRDV